MTQEKQEMLKNWQIEHTIETESESESEQNQVKVTLKVGLAFKQNCQCTCWLLWGSQAELCKRGKQLDTAEKIYPRTHPSIHLHLFEEFTITG